MITFTLGLIGIIITVFRFIYDPQKKSESNDLLMEQKMTFLREEYDKRFGLLQNDLATITKQNQNHLHTIDTKMDSLLASINCITRDLTRVETTLNERMPKKG